MRTLDRRRRWQWLLVLTGCLATAPARAAPHALEWIAPPGCPDAGQVRRRVEALSGRPAASWPPRFAVRARVARGLGGWRVALDFSPRGSDGARVFHGETCEAVSEAAALHIALGMEVDTPAPARPERSAASPRPGDEAPLVAIEVAAGVIDPGADEGNLEMERSGYARTGQSRSHMSLGAVLPLGDHLSLVGALSTLSGAEYARVAGEEEGPMEYRWRAYSIAVQARASWPLGSRLTPYVQAGAGATLAFDTVLARVDDDRGESLGWHARGGAGLLVRLGRSVALFGEAAYVAAPVHFSRNVAAQDYQSGGALLVLGGRVDFHRGDGP